MYSFRPISILALISTTTHAIPWRPQTNTFKQVSNVITQASCSGGMSYRCDSVTSIASCDTAISEACTYVTGNDGYLQNLNSTARSIVPLNSEYACVATVAQWPLVATGRTGYDTCVAEFQKITTTCFDPGNKKSQKGAGGAVNGNLTYRPVSGGVPLTTAPDDTLAAFYVRAGGCSLDQIGFPVGT